MKSEFRMIRLTILILCALACSVYCQTANAIDASGFVSDTTGKPIAGATIELLQLHGDLDPGPGRSYVQKVISTAASKSDGTYSMTASVPDGPADQLVLRALSPGMGYCTIGIRPDSPPDQRFSGGAQMSPMKQPWFVMLPARKVSGVVVDDQGKPIADCVLTPAPLPTWDIIRTDANGVFQIEHFTDLTGTSFEDSRQISFSQRDYVRRVMYMRSEQHKVQQPDGTWRITLQSGVWVSGHVTDADTHLPVPAAHITFGTYDAAITDADGNYAVRLPADTELSVIPQRGADGNPNYSPVERNLRQTFPASKPIVDDFDLHYRKGQTVAGTVHAASGDVSQNQVMVAINPVARGTGPGGRGAVATARSGGGVVSRNGNFSMTAVEPGSYELRVSYRPSGAPDRQIGSLPIEVVPGKDLTGLTIDVALPSDGARPQQSRDQQDGIQLTVLKPDGTPAILAPVRVMGPNPRFTDLNGQITFQPNGRSAQVLVAGDYSGQFAGTVRIERNPDLTKPLVIHMGPSAKLSGRMYDAAGKPVLDHQVNLSFSSSEIVDGRSLGFSYSIGTAWTDEQGRYSFRGIVSNAPGDRIAVGATQMANHDIYDLKPGQEITGLSFRDSSPGNGPAIMSVRPEKE